MLYNFSIDDLIPLLTIGALLITAIYHTVLYFINQSKLVGNYSLYLWTSFLFIVFANATKNIDSRDNIVNFILSAIVLWLSYSLYFRFIITTINPIKKEQSILIRHAHCIWFIFLTGILVNVTSYVVPKNLNPFFSLIALIFNGGVLLYVIIILYALFKEKRHFYHKNILGGGVCMVFFNIFNGIAMYNKGILFGIPSLSYICLGYFTEIIFFSIAISYSLRFDLNEKYKALAKIKTQELELALEKKKLTDTLLANDFEVQTERIKAIMQQRTLIGRKLHDELSGSLVALRYLIGDFKKKAITKVEEERLTDIEQELNTIYRDTRNYSHELAMNIEIAKNKLAYDIPSCLQKLENQFLEIGLIAIHSVYLKEELSRLSTEQNNHVYFFLKESFVNTIKHSKAQNIWVHIHFSANTCVVNFTDDGLGFANTATEGLGMSSIRNRARDLNAEFEIKTSKQGTILNLTFDVVH